MRKVWLYGGVSLFALSASGAFFPAHARVEVAADADIQEVIITGQKIEKSLKDVAASISVTTGAEIEREPIADLNDLILRVPNVTSSFGQQGFAIRGVDQRGIGGNGLTLTVYVDDAPLGNQTTFFGPLGSWDLGQVEVYRGPQSTNFGRNSLAGAIYVRTQDPTFELSGKARAEFGNNGIFHGAAALNVPVVDDIFAIRASGEYREKDGFIFNTFLDTEADAHEYKSGRIKLLFQASDKLKIISTSSYTENFGGEDGVSPFSGGNIGDVIEARDIVREVAYDTPGREGTESFIQSFSLDFEINETFSFKSITTYMETDYVRQEDFDTTFILDGDNNLVPGPALDRTGNDDAFTQELRLTVSTDDLNLVVGAYYADIKDGFVDSFVVPASILNPLLPPSLSISRTGTRFGETENYALYADGEYSITDDIDILFGIRYDDEKLASGQDTDTRFVPGIPPGLEPLLGPLEGVISEETDAEYDAFLPKIGIRWTPTDDIVLSFVAQKAYRAGGAEVNFVDNSIQQYDPEYLWNYEISMRSTWLDGKLQLNANIYYSDWSNQQVFIPLPPPLQNFSETVNAGESELYGFEADFTYFIDNEWSVYGAIGIASAELVDFQNGAFDPDLPESPENQANFGGNSFPYAPKASFNLGLDYRNEEGFFGGVDISHQSSNYNDNENFEENLTPSRTLVNARIGYVINENIEISGYAKNIFDVDYYSFLNRRGGFARLGDKATYAVRLDLKI